MFKRRSFNHTHVSDSCGNYTKQISRKLYFKSLRNKRQNHTAARTKKVQSGLNSRSFLPSTPGSCWEQRQSHSNPHKRAKHTSGDGSSDPDASQTVGGGGSLNSVPLPLSLTFPGLIYGTNRLSQKPQEPRNNDEKGPVGTGDARGCQLQAGGQCETFWDV